MLILARKSQETVVVGAADDMHEVVRVTVLDVRGGKVKLGFQADANLAIYREEVWARVRTERETPEQERVPRFG
jgi:carbon storage regulator